MAEEKIYNIRLTEAYKKAIRRRSPYAVRLVKEHVKRHSKAKDVKIGPKLNETIWARGITKPARSVRVKVVRDGDTAKAELMGFEYTEFRAKAKTERKGMKEKLMERLGPKAIKKEEEEKKIEGKERETAAAEAAEAGTQEAAKAAEKAEEAIKAEAKPAEAK